MQIINKEIIDAFYRDVENLGLKFPVAGIAKRTGFSKGNVSQYLSKNSTPSKGFLEEFYKCFEIVPPWEKPATPYLKKRNHLKNHGEKKDIPFYDAEAAAGSIQSDMTPIHAPAGTIDVEDLLRDSQAAIRIYGNSMIPNYPPGCVVGLARCQSKFIEPGEVYVIETRDRRMLKRLFYKDDQADADFFTCYSDNIMLFEGGARNGKLAYPPFDLPKDEIVNIFTVTGVIKRNANSIIINRN